MAGITANWSYPTSVCFGVGRIGELGEICRATGMKRPLLVTDRGLADLPITRSTVGILKDAGFEGAVFSEVDPNPTDRNMEAGIKVFLDAGHDGIVAFGGGSGLDLGKMIALMHSQKRPVWDFEDIGDNWTLADADAISPIVAVPTTAGTGSEVGRAGVLTNSGNHIKKIIFHPKLMPVSAICDPELTVGMPKAITAGTGMDAFAHCLEAYCSPHYHPMSQGIALEGLRLVKKYLLQAYNDGSEIEARSHMMSAASMGATAFQKGLGAIHALSHPVGALYGTHHGTTNAVVMPAVLRFNRPAIESRIDALAAYLGIAGGFDGFLSHVLVLRSELGIPERLGDMGVGSDRIDELADMAIKDPSVGGNPVELTRDNLAQLFWDCI